MRPVVKYSVFSFQFSVVRRCAVFGIVLAVTSAASGDVPTQVARLIKLPDLAPSLTGTEVSKVFEPWVARYEKTGREATATQLELLDACRGELEPHLPAAVEITLYSLLPDPVTNGEFDRNNPRNYDALRKGPLFHDYPVMGSLTISREAEVRHWMTFLKDQIVPGGFLACDFMPRHGFRFAVGKKHIDMLMCFSCDQLYLPNLKGERFKDNPIFSRAVRDILNVLFDKNRIERDKPKKG